VTTNFPHDVFDDEDPRIASEDRRYPRVVVMSYIGMSSFGKGQWSWGELNCDDEVEDTTLTGAVLDQIQRQVNLGVYAGEILVDGIPYQYVADRPKP